MPIAVSCACGKKLNVKDALAGKAIRCPGCQKVLKVPAGKPAPAAAGARPKTSGGAKPSPGAKPVAAKKPAPKPAGDELDLLGPDPAPPPSSGLDLSYDLTGDDPSPQAQLSKTGKKCPTCGEPYQEGDPYCISCGTDLKTGKVMAPPKPPSFLSLYGKRIAIAVVVIAAAAGIYFRFIKKKPGEGDQGPVKPAHEVFQELLRNAKPEPLDAFFPSMIDCLKAPPPTSPDDKNFIRHPVDVMSDEIATTSREETKVIITRLSYILAYHGFYTANSVRLQERIMGMPDPESRKCGVLGLYAMCYPKVKLPPLAFARDLDGKFAGVPKKELLDSASALNTVKAKKDDEAYMNLILFLLALAGEKETFHFHFNAYARGQQSSGNVIATVLGLKFDDFQQAELWWKDNQSKSVVDWMIEGLEKTSDEEVKKSIRDRLGLLGAQGLESPAQWKDWWNANRDKFQQ
ncbi:MAG: zinc ribbon domain-containing protein [Planctomycetes bacterium]|nr:zinc ribbon domain-containing protein [Planctomycetota bacterium]